MYSGKSFSVLQPFRTLICKTHQLQLTPMKLVIYPFFTVPRVDLVQLTLFNLSMLNKKKYYDIEQEIMPFLNQEWDNLQVEHVSSSSVKSNEIIMNCCVACKVLAVDSPSHCYSYILEDCSGGIPFVLDLVTVFI